MSPGRPWTRMGNFVRPRVGRRTLVAGVVTLAMAAGPIVAAVTQPSLAAESSVGADARPLAAPATHPAGLPWGAPIVSVGGNPLEAAVDGATNTIYVANASDGTISVINGAACDADHHGGCSQTPATVTVGNGPLGVVVDPSTNTIYSVNAGDGTVSVVDGRHCNGSDSSGCGQTPATVKVGAGPNTAALDARRHTLYVANSGSEMALGTTVSVVDLRHCNGLDTSGCGQTPSKVKVGLVPDGVAVDEATDTIYVSNGAVGTVSVIDGSTCNGSDSSGCGQTPATVAVGPGPLELAYDRSTHTVYTPVAPSDDHASLGFVAMIDETTCNAKDHAGCDATPLMAQVGSLPLHVAVDLRTHAVYVSNQEDSTVSMLDDRACNATDASGCPATPPALAIGFDPIGIGLNARTHTLYAPSQDTNAVWVLDASGCKPGRTTGCTRFAPTSTVGAAPQGIAANPSTHTIYVGNRNDQTVSVIDANACNAADTSGCSQQWATAPVADTMENIAVDDSTNSIYTADGFNGENTVSLIDGRHCMASDTSGCAVPSTTIVAGNGTFALAVDAATETLYVANRDDGTVSVIDTRHCDGADTSGCGQSWPTVTVGDSPQAIAVDSSTNTIYVTDTNANTVSVIDGSRCNGSDDSGCGQTPATVSVGTAPRAIGIDAVTHTVYVANRDDGTVSVIDARHCRGGDTSGCGQTPPAVFVGPFTGRGVAVDEAADRIYTTSIWNSDVVVVNGARCRAGDTTHCVGRPVRVRMGGWPSNVAVDPADGTFYLPQNVDGEISLFGLGGH